MATILLAGVDLFFRGKLDVLLSGHQLVTTDTVETPELVIADISRVEPDEVADAYPDIPIVGFTSHTDTAGLRRAHEAGFDQVLAKSALEERKTIDRAKGILMQAKGLSEEQAYALLRKTAMNEKRKIAEVAQAVITASELLK